VPRPQLLSHAYRLGGVERKATTTATLSSGRHDGMPTETARYWRHGAVPGVDLLRATYVTHRYARHAHETYTVGVIESGVEEFDYGGARLRAGPGAVALLNPEVVHTGQAGTAEGWSYRMLYPAVSLVAGLASELGAPRGTPAFDETVVDDARCARLLRSAHLAAEHGDRLASASLLTAALAGILRAHARLPGYAGRPARARKSSAAVTAVRDVLADRLADPPGLDELALATGMSPFALLRAFRDETGLPPHAYLNQLRVRLARRLLDSGLPPADVAARAGFADQPHLSRHFKRVVGVPPGAYQRERDAAAGARRGKNVQDSPAGRPLASGHGRSR
jgi:AraC-like DNA-binding protein